MLNKWNFALVLGGLMTGAPSALAGDYEVYQGMPSLTVLEYPTYGKLDRGVAADESLTEEQAEKLRSPQLKQLSDALLAVKSPGELDALLVSTERKLVANDQAISSGEKDSAKLLPDDYVFFASHIVLLRSLRGLVWKMIPVVKPYRVSHSQLLTLVRNVAKNMNTFFPRDTWKAGFHYVSEPFSAQDEQFKDKDHADLIQFFTKDVSASVAQAYERVNRVAASFTADLQKNPETPTKALLFDSQVAYGAANTFADGHYRYKVLGAPEVSLSAGGLALSLAGLKQASAYDLRGALRNVEIVSKVFGFDGLLTRLDGVTDEEVVSSLRKARLSSPKFLTLREGGAALMKQSYDSLTVAYGHLENAWKAVDGRPSDANRLLNPGLFRDSVISGRRSLKTAKKILGLPVTSEAGFRVRSIATNEVVEINLKPFFLNPPQDLLSLLPTGFEVEKERCPTYAGSSCKVKVRNYTWGSANAWNYSAHSYFPGLKGADDFQKRRRILAESSALWPAGLLLVVSP